MWKDESDFRLASFITAGSVPTAVIGFVFKDYFENFSSNLTAVGIALLVTSLLLTCYEVAKNKNKEKMNLADSVIIGIVQGYGYNARNFKVGFYYCDS